LNHTAFQQLVDIMAKLRSPDGCPWDREQTHDSLKPYLLEEAYEVLETLDDGDFDGLKEELGDLMLQVVFHAQLAVEKGRFSIGDVLDTINQKLMRRHPHVFGQIEIHTAEQQRIHWEKLKKKEGKTSVLDGVPKTLPALSKACRIQQKASTVGFDWEKTEQVWEKVKEEVGELEEVVRIQDANRIEEEFGDLLFALVNLSRFIRVDPENALRRAVDKFTRRFRKVEQTMDALGKNMNEVSLDEMDAVWDRIKHSE
jgi:tetrapyrrole methylase family protein/MazG family protein